MQTETIAPLDICGTACDLQSLLRRISHVVRALHDASDDVQTADDVTREAVNRICAFADIIGETAEAAYDKAEQIELGARRAKRAGKAA